MPKSVLVNALEKMHNVSTRALLPDFNFAGKVTVEANSKEVSFTSSNGCLTASCLVVSDELSILKPGKFTTDSVKLRDSVRRLATTDENSLIEISDDGTVTIRDVSSKKKRLVKIPKENTHHDASVIKKPDDASFFFETDRFIRGTKIVGDFQSRASYKIAYQLVLFHWTKSEARIVCGDGTIFAVFSVPKHMKDKSKREMRRVVPVAQLDIVNTLLADSSEIELVWKDKDTLWIQGDNELKLILRGMPALDYVTYESNAYLFDDAKAYVDIKISDLAEAANLIGVLVDKEKAEQGRPHSCIFSSSESSDDVKFEITQEQSKFQCEYEIPAVYHNLNGTATFKDRYAHLFLDNMVNAARHPYVRLYLIDEGTIANARDVDLGENDDNGIPRIKEEVDGCGLSYFFCPIGTDEEIDEEE